MREYEAAGDELNVEIRVLCSNLARFCKVMLKT